MKLFTIFWLCISLTSCSLMPEMTFLAQDIENEIASDLKIGREAIEKHNKDK